MLECNAGEASSGRTLTSHRAMPPKKRRIFDNSGVAAPGTRRTKSGKSGPEAAAVAVEEAQAAAQGKRAAPAEGGDGGAPPSTTRQQTGAPQPQVAATGAAADEEIKPGRTLMKWWENKQAVPSSTSSVAEAACLDAKPAELALAHSLHGAEQADTAQPASVGSMGQATETITETELEGATITEAELEGVRQAAGGAGASSEEALLPEGDAMGGAAVDIKQACCEGEEITASSSAATQTTQPEVPSMPEPHALASSTGDLTDIDMGSLFRAGFAKMPPGAQVQLSFG